MNKVKVLSIVSIGLLLTNLMLVAFIVLRQPPGPRHHEGPRDIIIEKLHFNEAQVRDYDSLIKGHRSAIKTSQDQIMSLKNQLYSTLLKENQNAVKDSIISQINQMQAKIEQIHYSHFEDIRHLCKNEQLANFEQLTMEIAGLFTPLPPKGRK
jgi:hypothetical protein